MNNIEKFLNKNNISCRTKGYYYLESAIEVSLQINNRKINPCSDIYPSVAKKYNTSVSAVEKSMRYTLKESEKYKNFTVGKFLNNEIDELKTTYKNNNKYCDMWNKLKKVLESITNANWITKEAVLKTMQELEKDCENE